MKLYRYSLKQYILLIALKYKFYLLSLCFIAIASGIFEISIDYKIKEIIDTIVDDKNADLAWLLVLFVSYNFMHDGLYFIDRLLSIKYKPLIIKQTILDIYSKTMQRSLHWFDSHLAGEISTKIEDFHQSLSILITDLFFALNSIATILIMLFFLLKISYSATLVIIIFSITHIPIAYWLLKKQMRLRETHVIVRQEVIGIINDSIANAFIIKTVGNLITEFKMKLKPIVNKWSDWDKRVRQFDTYFVYSSDIIMVTCMTTLQIYVLANLYQQGNITAGGFAFTAMVTLKINSQLDTFLDNLLFRINPNIAQVISSYAFVNHSKDIEDKRNASLLKNVKGNIKYSNVNFSYGDNKEFILHNFNLTIKEGEHIGIVGYSGSGKTTLVKCLLRYFDVTSGSISIDGNDIRDISQQSLRAAISLIPQDINMLNRSIKDNLRLAKYNASDEEIFESCKKTNIHDEILKMPEGYNTMVGERGSKISGGQRQRLAIARAILKNAAILILDEATSNLDASTEYLIQASISNLIKNRKTTVISISHKLYNVKTMDRIIFLDKGKIIEEGTHSELMKKQNGHYKKLWEMHYKMQNA
jgi:ATP-binding cassette subfamily B protein